MSRRHVALSIGLLLAVWTPPASAIQVTQVGNGSQRIWTDDTGSYEIRARLLEIDDEVAVMKKQNGVTIRVPFERLSAADLRYLERVSGRSILIVTPPKQPDRPVPTPSPNREPIKLDPTHFGMSDLPPRPSLPAASASKPNVQPIIDVGQATDSSTPADPSMPIAHKGTFQAVAVSELSLSKPGAESACRAIIENRSDLEVRSALDQLLLHHTARESDVVAKVVRNATLSEDKSTRLKALTWLGRSTSREDLPFLLGRLADRSMDVRWLALDLLEQSRTPLIIPGLIRFLDSPEGDRIATILESYGSASEVGLIELLGSKAPDVRLRVCHLLGEIGTERSILVLSTTEKKDSNLMVRLQAKSAGRKIAKRSKRSEASN